ncbi:MAG: FtsQ-type POTRA domain-containing protein [Vicinamibacterales bacterium]
MTPGLPSTADKRFRRAQVRPAGRRGATWRRALGGLRSAGLLLIVGLAVWRVVTLVTDSQTFRVSHIALHGNDRLSRGEAMGLVGDLVGRNILGLDLDAWRHRLMTSPWVEDAVVRRVLPNTLDVVVRERTPMGIARVGRDLFLVDRHGTMIDEYGPAYADLDLPVIDGLSTGSPADGPPVVDAARTALVVRLLADVGSRRQIASRVSQIDVRDARDAVVLLDGDTVLLRLGDRDFASRLQDYLDVATALKDRMSGIDTVDLRFGERMYVRPGRDDGAVPASRDAGRVGGQ